MLTSWSFTITTTEDVTTGLGRPLAAGSYTFGSGPDMPPIPAAALPEVACQVLAVLDALHMAGTGQHLRARLATFDGAVDGWPLAELAAIRDPAAVAWHD